MDSKLSKGGPKSEGGGNAEGAVVEKKKKKKKENDKKQGGSGGGRGGAFLKSAKEGESAEYDTAKVSINMGDSDSEEMSTVQEDVRMKDVFKTSIKAHENKAHRKNPNAVATAAESKRTKIVVDAKAPLSGKGVQKSISLDPSVTVDTERLGNAVTMARETKKRKITKRSGRHDKNRLEPLSAVAVESMREYLSVYPGESQRKAYEEMARLMQKDMNRAIDWSDVPELHSRVQKKAEEDMRNRNKASRVVQISDNLLTELAEDHLGGKAISQLAKVRARIDSDTASELKVSNSVASASSLRKSRTSAQMLEDVKNPTNSRKRAHMEAEEHREQIAKIIDPLSGKKVKSATRDVADNEDSEADKPEIVEHEIVKLSHAKTAEPLSMPASATTPLPGTEQRRKIDNEIEQMKKDKVLVTKASEKAIRATSAASGLPVQGKKLEVTNAAILGDGTLEKRPEASATAHSPSQYLLDILDRATSSPQDLIELSLAEFETLAKRAVEAYHAFDDVAPEDAPSFDKASTGRLLDDKINVFINRYREKRRTTMSQYIDSQQAALPPKISELEDLRRRLIENNSESNVQAAVDAAIIISKERNQNRSSSAAAAAASGDRANYENRDNSGGDAEDQDTLHPDDVKEASKRKMSEKWIKDNINTELALRDMDATDDDIEALTLSHGSDANKHAFLKQLKHSLELSYFNEHVASNDLQNGGIVSEHGNIRMRSNGEQKSLGEDFDEVSKGYVISNYMQSIHNEYTRDIRKCQSAVKKLEAKIEKGETISMKEAHKLQESQELLKQFERHASSETYLSKRSRDLHTDAAILYKQRQAAADLPVVRRSYIKDYLREPLPSQATKKERMCILEKDCICNLAAAGARHAGAANVNRRGFVCREFLMPDQEFELQQSGNLPKERQLCYMCQLFQTLKRVSELRSKGESGMTMMILQPFSVVFCEPGEYSEHVGNLGVQGTRFYGMVAPFPMFNMENYDYRTYMREGDDGREYKLLGAEESADVVFR